MRTDLVRVIEELLRGYPLCDKCLGDKQITPLCRACLDGWLERPESEPHRCHETLPCCVEPTSPTAVCERAQATLDAIPIVRWKPVGVMHWSDDPRGWTLVIVPPQPSGCPNWRWGVRLAVPQTVEGVGFLLVREGESDTFNEAQNTAVAALRSLGVVVREGAE